MRTRNIRTILSATFLLLTATWAAQGEPDCEACVEDVVVETRDGLWLSGYVYWNKPPFHYLDLGRPADRLNLERGTGSTQKLRLWTHAVSISRDRFPSGLGEPPPAPAPASEFARPIDEIALLAGEPIEILLESLDRIYPRIGSGLPGFEISDAQLPELAAANLPFHAQKLGGCMGCPLGVEDVTIVLTSGKWASGLMAWHAATAILRGYDLREPPPRDHLFEWPEEVVLWQGVSGPRRTFESAGSTASGGELVKQRGFLRVAKSVLLVGEPVVYPRSEVAFILPGPSKSSYPLLINREIARRLLLRQPVLAMESHRHATSAYCFSYEPDTALEDLAKVCSARAFGVPGAPVKSTVVEAPGDRRHEPPIVEGSALLGLHFNWGT